MTAPMHATLTPHGALATLTATSGEATQWLRRSPIVERLRRTNVGGELAVTGERDTIETLARRMTSDGLNILIEVAA